MTDNTRPSYTEALTAVRENLATLNERTQSINRRLDNIETKLDEIVDIKERVATVETKLHISSIILGGLSLIGNTIAAAIGIRQ